MQTPFFLCYDMNRIYNVLWLQMFLKDEYEEENEGTSSDEEDNTILQAVLIKRLNNTVTLVNLTSKI